VGDLPDAPAVVLVATTLAAAMLLIEAALPTFGLAGATALGLGIVAALSADPDDGPLWPLLLVVAAVGTWAVVLTLQRPASTDLQVVAAAMFAVGSIGYGILATDVLTVVIAVAGSAALPVAFPTLQRAARRLVDMQPQVGMEALVGRTGEVVRIDGDVVTVRVDGSFWNARSPAALSPGTHVVVLAFTGMTLEVAPTGRVGS
jgi:membrane protein implicated in regulation of membrane protease activity